MPERLLKLKEPREFMQLLEEKEPVTGGGRREAGRRSAQPPRVARRATQGFHFAVAPPASPSRLPLHSHSIVAGGFELTSYTTRLIPGTWLMIRLEILPSTS